MRRLDYGTSIFLQPKQTNLVPKVGHAISNQFDGIWNFCSIKVNVFQVLLSYQDAIYAANLFKIWYVEVDNANFMTMWRVLCVKIEKWSNC